MASGKGQGVAPLRDGPALLMMILLITHRKDPMILNEILIIFVLLLINGFFALSEIAIVSASKPMLRQLAKQGNARAAKALRLGEDPGKFLSSVQVGITLVGILAGAYGGATIAEKITPFFDSLYFIAPHGGTVAVAIIVTAITYFSVVIGELVPKQAALSNPEKLAMIVAGPMLFLAKVATPIVWVLEGSGGVLMQMLGILKGREDQVTEEEVRAILTGGAESGALEKSEHDMLQRVIRLGDRDVKSIMTHRTDVTFIDINDSLETIRKKVHEAGHSRYPVIDGSPDRVIGVVQAKELLDGALSFQELNLMSYVKEAHVLSENTPCLSVLEHFKAARLHLTVVVDEYGITKGIVTTSDILEAIVGIIPSNYDSEDQELIVQREDGSWLVDGRTPIDEIHLSIGLDDIGSDGDFDTIAGFVLHNLRKAPQEGAAFELYGCRFEIMDMDGRRIDKILISQSVPVETDDKE